MSEYAELIEEELGELGRLQAASVNIKFVTEGRIWEVQVILENGKVLEASGTNLLECITQTVAEAKRLDELHLTIICDED